MSKLDPDTTTQINLIATAERLFFEHGDRDAALAELERIAGGRVDLLSTAAGHYLGVGTWNSAACHMLLFDAGGNDRALSQVAAKKVRANRDDMGRNDAGIIR